MGTGERLTLISTMFWTLHITYTDIATAYVDSMHMMVVQLTVVSVLSGNAHSLHLISPLIWMNFDRYRCGDARATSMVLPALPLVCPLDAFPGSRGRHGVCPHGDGTELLAANPCCAYTGKSHLQSCQYVIS